MSREPPFDQANASRAAPRREAGRHAPVADKRLTKGHEAVSGLETFIAGLGFLSPAERCALVIAGGEVVDNLISHGEVGSAGITVRVRKEPDGILMFVLVESHQSFSDFAKAVQSGQVPGPRYNTELKRWHGLGLTMCRNLATRIHYRAGELTDRVILEFATRP